MIVNSDVKVPGFPLLGIKSFLALLEPCIFENFEHREEHGHSPEPVRFTHAMPVFGSGGEGSQLICTAR